MIEKGGAANVRPTGRRLRIAIASLGRFHVLDLARELAALGHDVRFYSYVPRRRARRFGLPTECHVALLPLMFPLLALQRLLPRRLGRRLDTAIHIAADAFVRLRMRPCDVFICMSGVYVEAALAARKRYGALIYLERGSRHILSQSEILSAIPGADIPTAMTIRRELRGYEIADQIVVASTHVEESFLERGVPRERLFRNPYGVDLEMFPPTELRSGIPPTVLFVGNWSLRKGADVLTCALRKLANVHLLHVGPIGDLPFPDDTRFRHIPPVPQWNLKMQFSQAHVFVLASREEGLALVQAQALACGLPVVCTDRTGGEDLGILIERPDLVEVVPAGNAELLAESLRRALARVDAFDGPREWLRSEQRGKLSWQAYGSRYASNLLAKVAMRAASKTNVST